MQSTMIVHKAARLFSTENSDLLAALMDALAVALVTLPVWAAYTAFINPNYITPFSIEALIGMFIYTTMALAISYITIAALEDFNLRKAPRARRSALLTVVLVLAAIALPVGGMMKLCDAFDLSTGLEMFATFGLIAVPSAIRLSSPSAFAWQHRCTPTELADRLIAS